ncbi:MAG: Phosphatidate cytidylyltransferase [candidate division TM6 bacterium GW2011_GWF2_30_66]|nr:MAG: Phosphatidate cytidylyltransferase [candidate division TM6 bacterium GW2011_GWF2_30_66]
MKNLITRIATGITLISALFYLFFYAKPIVTSLSFIAILFYIIIFEFTKLFDYKKLIFWLILPFYPILPFILLSYMSYYFSYRILIFYMLILTFSQDVGGYIFGSLFGKNKLAPKLSPKKSWEGFFGGYIFVIITLITILFLEKSNITIKLTPFILIFSLAISIFSTSGDLLESWLKRNAGIKDTGNILPGHGGFLDRFDSSLLIIFIFFIFKDHLLKIFNI